MGRGVGGGKFENAKLAVLEHGWPSLELELEV